MVHYSKKDRWLVGTVLLAILVPLTLGAFFLLLGGANREAGRSLLVIGAVTGLVVTALTYPLYYQITASELIVRCGILMRRHIPLASIDEVRPDRNPASAPAWSLDRLRVAYRQGGQPTFIMISPQDQSAFMREMAKTDADLRMENNSLIRQTRPA